MKVQSLAAPVPFHSSQDPPPLRHGLRMERALRDVFAPVRFFTPFPHRPSWRLRNSAFQLCRFEFTIFAKSISNGLILSCSDILGGRFHRLPSRDESGRLNLPMSLNPPPNALFFLESSSVASLIKKRFYIGLG